ncbi:MAG: metalloregulator ArsR/SmtB family transcription factor [Planctomycetota bacterium]
MMKNAAKLFRALGDETRLRLLHLLSREELTARELEEVTNLGQSRVSAQLATLREAVPLAERRCGRRVHLRVDANDPGAAAILELVEPMIADSEACRADRRNLDALLRARRGDDDAALGLGRGYLPGRSWEGFARALLTLVRPGRLLDVGVGDGELTLLLAASAASVVAVDPDPAARERLRRKAEKRGVTRLEIADGDLSSLPVADASCDLVLLSQVLHCAEDVERALDECARALAPQGRLLILDLKRHAEAWVRERLDHRHLGFEERELRRALAARGLAELDVRPVSRDERPPHFVTLLATGIRETRA